MTGSIDPALVSRLSDEFTALGTQMGALGRDLELLHRQVLASFDSGAADTHGTLAAAPPTRTSPASGGSAPGGESGTAGTMSKADAAAVTPDSRRRAGGGPAAYIESAPNESALNAPPEGSSAGHAEGSVVTDAAETPLGSASSTATESSSGRSTGIAPDTRGGAPGASAAWTADTSSRDARTGTWGGAPAGGAPSTPAGNAWGADTSGVPAVPMTSPGRGGPGAGPVPPGWAVPPGGPRMPGARYVPNVPPQGYGPGYGAAPMPRPWGAGPGAPRPRGNRPVDPGRAVVRATPWWQRDGMISRVLAVAGVAVTLIGVVMLLVLAAQAGLFGPLPRVLAGAVFSAALVGAGIRVSGRTGGRVGGIALAATGIAGGYLDVVAVTAIYDWLHPVPGFGVALAVAAGGVALAMRWNSQPLAVLVVAGAALSAPLVTTETVLVTFLIVLQLSCLPVHRVRDWPYLHVVRTLPVVIATIVFVAVAAVDGRNEHVGTLLTAAVAIAVVGLVGALLVARVRQADLTASLALAAAATPLLVAAPALLERRTAVVVALGYATVLLAVSVVHLMPKLRAVTGIAGHTALVTAVVGAVSLLEACVGGTDSRTLPIALFLAALGFTGVAGQQRSRVAAGLGAAFGVIGGLAFLAEAGPETLASQEVAQDALGTGSAVAAIAGLAVLAVTAWSLRRIGTGNAPAADGASAVWVAASVAALYLVTAASVAIGVAVGGGDGFVVGHSVATILWMASASGALFYGLRNLSAASGAIAKVALGSGLLLTAAAIAKLFLFDLATLDGFVRVIAFLAVGVLLLLTGTRYARAFAEAGERANRSQPVRTAESEGAITGDSGVEDSGTGRAEETGSWSSGRGESGGSGTEGPSAGNSDSPDSNAGGADEPGHAEDQASSS